MPKIKNLKLKNKFFLAPMHNVNDIAFRTLCSKAGASLVFTELTNPETKAPINFSDKPAIQLVCNRTKKIKEFIKKHKAPLYDFNLGCPSPHAKKSKVGYFTHKNYKIIEDILKEMQTSTNKPITIKIRIMDPIATKKITSLANKYCDAIAIHPRTQKQGYAGLPDLKYAKKIKKLSKIPIIYSGNITNKKEAKEILKTFDFAMIGRKAIGNPNIFYELTNKKPKKQITFKDYLKLAIKHKIDFNQIKRQAIFFTKGKENSTQTRKKLVFAKSIKDIKKILEI